MVHVSGGQRVFLPPDLGEWFSSSDRWLDDHVHDVPDSVFELLRQVTIRVSQSLTVIIERDGAYPAFTSLIGEVRRARETMKQARWERRTEAHHERTLG